jgi:hypothetical protein
MFLEFAAKEGFNPLIADNWYPIARTQVAKTGKVYFFSLPSLFSFFFANSLQGATSCFSHYSSISHALLSLFPDIGLEESKFSSPRCTEDFTWFAFAKFLFSVTFWKNTENKKNLLADFARVRGFDPNNTENWYSVTLKDIESSGVIF